MIRPINSKVPLPVHQNGERFDCTGNVCKTICKPGKSQFYRVIYKPKLNNLGYTPFDRRSLKCGNDHKWYHIDDFDHAKSFPRSPYTDFSLGSNLLFYSQANSQTSFVCQGLHCSSI